jgi:hypothetical protein
MFKNPLLIIALAITGAIALWGIVDTAGLAAFAAQLVQTQFTSRAWFIDRQFLADSQYLACDFALWRDQTWQG